MIDRINVEYEEDGTWYIVVYDDGEEVKYRCASDVASVLEQNEKIARKGG